MFLIFSTILAIGNPFKNENIFKFLKNDVPSDKAILIIDLKFTNSFFDITESEILFNRNSTVYSCSLFKFGNIAKFDKQTKTYSVDGSFYFTVEPGDLDINLIEITTTNGNYSSSIKYPLSGKFSLKAGSINYLGEIKVNAQSNGLINQGGNIFNIEKFKTLFPKILNAANGQINDITLSASTPVETAEAIFTDNFNQGNNNWVLTNDNLHKTTISEGIVLINNQSKDSCVFYRNTELPKSFDVQVETSWLNGETNKAFGLIIGNDPQNCIKFSITSNGYLSIFRWLPPKVLKWVEQDIYNWTKSDKINTQLGEKNTIRVQKTGWYMHTVEVIAFYINDNLVARNVYYLNPLASSQFDKQGIIGFYTYGEQSVSIDNFIISNLKK
jgi:hypothetical protein